MMTYSVSKSRKIIAIAVFTLLCAALPAASHATAVMSGTSGSAAEEPVAPAPVPMPLENAPAQNAKGADGKPAAVDVSAAAVEEKEQFDKSPFRDSLFFTPAEIVGIDRALKGLTVGNAVLSGDGAAAKPIPVKRTITLSGVYFKDDKNWIIWMNGQKLTPGRLLPEIQDIKVSDDEVHLKWFDIGLNAVITITLHPHQTYDIVTGLLLPG
jgi:hypothetical protein